MFCRKCGNQFPDDSVFCQKCGTEVAADTDRQTSNTTLPAIEAEPSPAAEPSPVASAAPTATVQTVADNRTDDTGFKVFVDNHVRSTTKFRSADDLLRNSKPLTFMWVILVVSFILGSIVAFPFGGFVFLILGYAAVFIASGIIRMQYGGRYSGEFVGEIDIEELLGFLSENLKRVHPDFHEWGYLSKNGGLLPTLENAIADATGEVRICSEFGTKRNRLVALYIKPKTVDAEPGEKLYFVDALKKGFLADGRAAGFLGHGTLIRTAPILQAAMEYYLMLKENGDDVQNSESAPIGDDTALQKKTAAAGNPIHPQTTDSHKDKPVKKNRFIWPVIFFFLAIAIAAIAIAVSSGGGTDYVATVKAHTPFAGQGYSHTYGTVLNNAIDSPIWEVSKVNDQTYVNVRGKTKDAGDSILVSFQVTAGANDQAAITPASVVTGGETISDTDSVVRFLLDLFAAYGGGSSEASPSPKTVSYTTYTSKDHGFSFRYPSDWTNGGSQSAAEIVRIYDGKGASISVSEVYVLPFELDTGDEMLIKAAVNDNGIMPYEFVSVDDVGVNGRVMRELIYTSEDAVHGALYLSNYFYFIGEADYQIKVELPADTVDSYQSVFETMMNSYTVTAAETSDVTPEPPDSGDTAPETTESELTFNGWSIANLLGARPKYLYDYFGPPEYGTPIDGYLYNGGEYYGYDGAMFLVNPETDSITGVEASADAIRLDGTATFDKTRTELVRMLGEPSYEGYDDYSNSNIMKYILWDVPYPILIILYMSDETAKANYVTILPYQDGP